MCILDSIIIYEAMLGDFPSLSTPQHTGQSHASMVVRQLFLIRMLWGVCVCGFSFRSLSLGRAKGYKINGADLWRFIITQVQYPEEGGRGKDILDHQGCW